MSDDLGDNDLSENIEMMCLECGLPYADHVGDADRDMAGARKP